MKVIIEDYNGRKYNLNLSEEQAEFAKWLVNNDVLYEVNIIDNMDWEDV